MLRSTFLTPKAVKFLQILLKVYIKRHVSSSADLVNTVNVVQEKISGSNSSQLPSNLAQKHSSGATNC